MSDTHTIESIVEAIKNTGFRVLKAGVCYKCTQVVRIDDTLYIRLTNGDLVSSDRALMRKYNGMGGVFPISNFGFTSCLLRALVILKIITKEQMREHKNEALKRDIERDRKHKLERLTTMLGEYNIELTPKQKKMLNPDGR